MVQPEVEQFDIVTVLGDNLDQNKWRNESGLRDGEHKRQTNVQKMMSEYRFRFDFLSNGNQKSVFIMQNGRRISYNTITHFEWKDYCFINTVV